MSNQTTTTGSITTSQSTTVSTSSVTMSEPTVAPEPDSPGEQRFLYAVSMIFGLWTLLAVAYAIARWRQRPRAIYIIPRVFVLCSPRTVQFHYEIILRIGLPSPDFNPDRHDIDITVQGQHRNEVVPMTRLNTKTLYDEPLITSLSIIAYRLVEMPALGTLILRHSGPFKAWIYAYDFTVIDLSTNREYYYPLNQYVGSLNKIIHLGEPNNNTEVHYPVDDVPMPQWSLEDIYLVIFSALNAMLLALCMPLPVNCSWYYDILSVILAALLGYCVVIFLEWLIYYYLRWNQDRKEYFNEYETCVCMLSENKTRILIAVLTTLTGAGALYFATFIHNWRSSVVWMLAVANSSMLVVGVWNATRSWTLSESIVSLGLRMRGVESFLIGMQPSDMTPAAQTKSGSTSDDGNNSLVTSFMSKAQEQASKMSESSQGIGPRPSFKSFGFELLNRNQNAKQALANMHKNSSLSASSISSQQAASSMLLRPAHAPRVASSTGPRAISEPTQSTTSAALSGPSRTNHSEGPSSRASSASMHSSQASAISQQQQSVSSQSAPGLKHAASTAKHASKRAAHELTQQQQAHNSHAPQQVQADSDKTSASNAHHTSDIAHKKETSISSGKKRL